MSYASENDIELLELLKSGDDLALVRLCDDYYDKVYTSLCRFYATMHREEPTLLADVVTDTFLKFSRNPWSYKPEKLSLERFLLMDAEGDLKNEWSKRKRQSKKWGNHVELSENIGNREETPLENMIQKEQATVLDKLLEELFPVEPDFGLAQLMLAGERRTEEYARLLQIEHLDLEQQRREVKRTKDRLDKVIRRKWQKGGKDV